MVWTGRAESLRQSKHASAPSLHPTCALFPSVVVIVKYASTRIGYAVSGLLIMWTAMRSAPGSTVNANGDSPSLSSSILEFFLSVIFQDFALIMRETYGQPTKKERTTGVHSRGEGDQ